MVEARVKDEAKLRTVSIIKASRRALRMWIGWWGGSGWKVEAGYVLKNRVC